MGAGRRSPKEKRAMKGHTEQWGDGRNSGCMTQLKARATQTQMEVLS